MRSNRGAPVTFTHLLGTKTIRTRNWSKKSHNLLSVTWSSCRLGHTPPKARHGHTHVLFQKQGSPLAFPSLLLPAMDSGDQNQPSNGHLRKSLTDVVRCWRTSFDAASMAPHVLGKTLQADFVGPIFWGVPQGVIPRQSSMVYLMLPTFTLKPPLMM